MPKAARILRFPNREVSTVLPAEESRRIADGYLNTPASERSEDFVDDCFQCPDVILAVLNALRDIRDVSPAKVASEAP